MDKHCGYIVGLSESAAPAYCAIIKDLEFVINSSPTPIDARDKAVQWLADRLVPT